MKSIKRFALCMVLIFVMILPLAACQKKGKQTATIDKNTVYKEEMLNIKFSDDLSVYDSYFSADKVYYFGYKYNQTDGMASSVWGTVNYDGSGMTSNKLDKEGSWIERMAVSAEGDVYLLYSESFEDYSDPDNYIYENSYYLKRCDASGAEKASVNLKEKYQTEWTRDIITLSDGNVLLVTGDKFIVLDKDLKEVRSKAYDSFDGTFYKIKDGSVTVLAWEEGGNKLYRYDVNKFERGEEIQIPFSMANFGMRDGCGKYDFILTDSTQVYVYNIGDTAPRALLNYVNSDIVTSGFNTIYLADDNTIYGFYNYYDDDTDGRDVARYGKYTKVAPEDVVDKKVLSLGCLWVDTDVKKRVISFNKTSSEYRIVITDYSQYDTEEDWMAGTKKFNSDVASGQAPDIVIANDPSIIHNYISKGLFADLTDYIKNDPDINFDDIFPNLIKASSYNDKIYEIVPSFTISTVAGKKSVLGDRNSWTMEEFLQFKNSLQPGMSMFADATRENMLYNFLSVNVSDYMDFGKGKCYFDTPEFVSLLEYLKEFPKSEEMYTNEYWENYDYESAESAYRENKVVLSPTSIYDIRELKYLIRGTFGEAVTFIGYPCKEGNGSSINPMASYAISAKSAYKDAAWDFVKYYYSNEYQQKLTWGIPASMAQFDENAKQSTEKPYYMDENNQKVEYDDTYYINGQEIVIEPLSEAEIAGIKEFVKSVDRISSYSEDIQNIITEDAEPFFQGQKTAEEVAKIIQSRANIYINEKQ